MQPVLPSNLSRSELGRLTAEERGQYYIHAYAPEKCALRRPSCASSGASGAAFRWGGGTTSAEASPRPRMENVKTLYRYKREVAEVRSCQRAPADRASRQGPPWKLHVLWL